MLRFDRIRAHEIGPFKDVDVDLAALPALVAIVGPNGAGKSTLLELLAAAAYRECPTRGALAGLARARDSFVEVGLTNGKPWTIRQSVDAISGKGEALVLDGAGQPAFDSTKVRAHDEWARAHLPAPGVLYASTFGVQGSAGFLDLRPSERKAILVRVLGVERLEALAEKARENLRDARGRHATASALVEAVVGVSAEQAERAWLDLVDVEVLAIGSARDAVARLRKTRELAAARADAMREARARAEQREGLGRRIDAIEVAVIDAQGRIANNRALLDRRAEIECAVADVAEHRAKIPALEAQLAAARDEEHKLDSAVSTAFAPRADLDEWAQKCAARERRATPIATRRPAVDAAIARVPVLQEALTKDLAYVDGSQITLDELLGRTIDGAEQRIAHLREGLIGIRNESDLDHAQTIAAATIDFDDLSVEEARELPEQRERARAALAAARADLAETERQLRDAERLAAQLDEVKAAQVDLVGVAAERGQIEEARAKLVDETKGLAAQRDAVRERRYELAKEISERGDALRLAERRAGPAEKLAQATARVEELEASIAKAIAERVELHAQLGQLGTDDSVTPPEVDVAGAERAESAAQQALARASSARAVALREYELAKERDARRAKLEADRDAIAVDISDWTRLAADLGRDGIQALEIDAAGPELSALANDLLHTCVGPRWTVTIDTQRLGADGRLLESLEVRVLDTVAGREGTVETFSGGERVLLGEAVSLALAMLACRRSGQRDVTIVRDESGAALDGERARAYVAMLRRALTLTGARQVLLVSHSPDVADLCDARLHVEGGKVEVRA